MPEFSALTTVLFPGAEHLQHDIYPTIDVTQTSSLKQSGKVILITGAGRGIGRAVALQYALADVASIILVARTASQLDEVESAVKKVKAGIRIHKFPLDVTDDAAVAHCAQEVQKREGRLDVLVNNAGTSAPWVPIAESDPTRYWSSISINLKGPYLFLQAFLPLLQKTAQKHDTTATVINVTSIGALVIRPTSSDYGIGKAALNTLTQYVDAEYQDKGIQAFSLHPGGVNTELTKSDETIVKALNGLLVDTEELPGGFCVWLSAADRKWLSGRYLAATWDVQRLEQLREEITEDDKLIARIRL